MKLLKCKACGGEVEILDSDSSVNKKIKCLDCGFNNTGESLQKKPEVVIMRRRTVSE